MKKWFLIYLLTLITVLVACSDEFPDQVTTSPTVPRVETATIQASPTSAVAPTLAPEVTENISPDTPPWADLDLNGRLYYLGLADQQQQTLRQLDLESGEEKTIFISPENGWLGEIAVSPDGSQILLAYSPPPESGQVQMGFTDLFLLPADGSGEPTLLLQRADPSEAYFNVSWPVADTIYYAHFALLVDDAGVITYDSQVERLNLLDGQTEILATGAAWPRVSNDGTMLAYVTEENAFILAGSDGSNPRQLLDSKAFPAVDAPLFSPDNRLICFSAVEPVTASRPSFWDWLWGVKVAQAHSVPSDWWCMPVDGSEEPVRLTNLGAIGLYGDFDLDGHHIAFITSNAVQVMNADGSDLVQLREIPTIGTLDWVP